MTIRRPDYPAARTHTAPVDLGSLDFPPPPVSGRVLLLVDDVCTSGAPARDPQHLAGQGVEAVPQLLGINARLLAKDFDAAPLVAQWEHYATEVPRAALCRQG